MANIDVVLDAEDEVTPTFTLYDVMMAGGQNGDAVRVVVQAARTTNTGNAVNIALDACVVLDDLTLMQRHNGTSLEDAWHETSGNFIQLSSDDDNNGRRDDIDDGAKLQPGLIYRVRYNSAQTDPVRVVIFTPNRKA